MIRAARRRRSGMTLIELLIAIGLSSILVGVAAYVFTQSQKIVTRVGGRLDNAAGFRTVVRQLEQDLARMESPSSHKAQDAAGNTISHWINITQGQRASAKTPSGRADVLRFVTHASVATQATATATPEFSDQLVLVTYRLDLVELGGKSDRGLVRELELLTLDASNNAVADNKTLPANATGASGSTTAPLVTQLMPGARGLRFRYVKGGQLADADPSAGSSDGSAFWIVPNPSPMPSPPPPAFPAPPPAIEVTVFAPEGSNADSTKISFTRAIQVLAPSGP